MPEYGSDEDYSPKQEVNTIPGGFLSLDGGMEVLPTYPPAYQGNVRSTVVKGKTKKISKTNLNIFLGSGIEGGMPGPSHGNAEPNQEQGK